MERKRFQLDIEKVKRWDRITNNPSKECYDFGMIKGCSKECPVYQAEECLNQLSNEKFFKWIDHGNQQ